MKSFTLFALALSLLGGRVDASWCDDSIKLVRQEWRNMIPEQRRSYIQSMYCMMSTPSKYTKWYPGLKNRYDDFVVLHATAIGGDIDLNKHLGWESFRSRATVTSMKSGIYESGTSIPWHRYFLKIWEDALTNECGWSGGIPYWDWFLDTPDRASSFDKSPLFSKEDGFGGNGALYYNPVPWTGIDLKSIPGVDPAAYTGRYGGGCLTDGPFEGLALHVGPMGALNGTKDRCLTREINIPAAHNGASGRNLKNVLEAATFEELRERIEVGYSDQEARWIPATVYPSLYSIGYSGIGGEMADIFNAANDPLFFLHTANIDRIWYLWQNINPQKRLYDIASGSRKRKLGIETVLKMGVFAPSLPLKYILDTESRNGSDINCYKYDGLQPTEYRTLGPNPQASGQWE